MIRRILPWCLFLLGMGDVTILAGDKAPATKKPPLTATLAPAAKGWVRLTLTNNSDKSIVLVDVQEGSGFCDKVWRVEVQVEGQKVALKPCMVYAPALAPFAVTLKAGEKRVRDFQPGAYVPLYGQDGKLANVVIHYEVEPAYFKQFTTAPHVRFSSTPVRIKLE